MITWARDGLRQLGMFIRPIILPSMFSLRTATKMVGCASTTRAGPAKTMFGRQSLSVINTPQRSPTVPGVFKKTSFLTGLLVDGTVVSEVGDPTMVRTWFGDIAGFCLRRSRITPRTRPFVPYGGMMLGEALSSPAQDLISLPAAGSRIVLTPLMPPLLADILTLTHHHRADLTVIIHIPVPLGMSVLLRIYCPELDDSTKTRGIIWKPGGCQTLAFCVGWDIDVPLVRNNAARPGSNGLTLAIETTEDNSIETFPGPASALLWYYWHNIEGYGWTNSTNNSVVPSSWQFMPIKPAPDQEEEEDAIVWEQMMEDSNSEIVPGGLGDAPEPGESLAGTPSAPEPTEVETNAPPAETNSAEKAKPKIPTQNAAINQKWHKFTTLTFAFKSDVGVKKPVEIVPARMQTRGEGIFRPFRRNIFCAGSRKGDQIRCLEWKIVSNRSPGFAGVLRITTLRSNYLTRGDVYYHTLGAEPTVFSDYGDSYITNNGSGADQRAVISPWRRCGSWKSSFTIDLAVVNRTQEHTQCSITVFVRLGGMRFSVPIKPKNPPASTGRVNLSVKKIGMSELDTIGHMLTQMYLEPQRVQEQMYEDPAADGESSEIAPSGIVDGYEGLAAPLPVDAEHSGDLDQDIFWLRIGDVTLQENTPVGVTLKLPQVLDVNGEGDVNPITERFERYVDLTPTRHGVYGPVFGKYAVKIRPPAGTTFDVEHVCLPPELNDETALRIFGLESLLSIAGSAIQSVGGSLLGGALSTAGGALGGILGGPVGGVISNILGGVLGGASSNQEDTTSVVTPAPEKEAPLITGDISFSRFLEFFKSFADSENNELAWPTLLLKMVNLLTDSSATRATGIPATIYLRMDAAQCTRAAWERTIVNASPVSLTVSLPVNLEQFGLFLQALARSRHPSAAQLARKCLTVLSTREIDQSFQYDLVGLPLVPVDQDLDMELLFTRLAGVRLHA